MLLELGQRLVFFFFRQENAAKEGAESEPHTHTHGYYCVNRSYGSKAVVKSVFVKWKIHHFETAPAQERQAARHGPELKRSWDLIRCGSLSLARETSSRSRSSCSLPLTSSKCEVVALQSVYCPLAFIWQDSFGTGRSIWKKRWRKKHRPLTDPNLANGMQSVSLKNCRFFFPSEPHRIC